MSEPIQALAPGYLNLLGLKNQGQLPTTAIDSLSPIIDMLQFYLLQTRERITGTFNIGLNQASLSFGFLSGGNAIQVPQNEIWRVHGFYASAGVGAAERMNLRAAIFNEVFSALYNGSASDLSGALYTGAANLITDSINEVWAPSGSFFGGQLLGYTGAARTLFGDLVISRIRI